MMKVILLLLCGILALASATSEKKVVCYFGGWSVYRPGNGKFDISYIDPTLCTHLIYTFVGIGEDGSVRVLDPWADLAKDYGLNGYGKFNKLRSQNPNVKTMIAIGGWNEGSAKYSHVVSNPSLRKRFVDSAYNFVKKYGFDGFDMDWEYPNQRGGVQTDKKNHVLLLKELREKFDTDGLILSAAVAAAEVSAGKSYIISEMSKYLHFINLMAYDLHGVWDKKTGINAPLYAGSWEQGDEAKLNVNASVHYWLDNGAPAEKIVVGVPLYGRGFTLQNPQQNEIGAPANAPAQSGPYTGEPGMLGYNEICEMIQKQKWTVHFQEEQRVPYAVKGNQWVGYDDKRSLKEKAEFVNKLGLGGMMVWSVETDDFRGSCGEKYPLLKSINSALGKNLVSQPSKLEEKNEPDASNEVEANDIEEGQDVDGEDNNEDAESIHDMEDDNNKESNHVQSESNDCKKEGYVRDPQDHDNFYYCQSLGGKFIKFPYKCPTGTVFDTCLKICNWKSSC